MSEWGVRVFSPELEHHGIKGQKWGVRRFDYVKKGRHSSSEDEKTGRVTKDSSDTSSDKVLSEDELARREKLKKIAKYVAIGGGVALGAYGLYKLSSINSAQKQLLLDQISKIDKNVSVQGWNREVQNKLTAKRDKYGEMLSSATTKYASANLKWKNLNFSPNYSGVDYSKDIKALETEKSRANLLVRAAQVMYNKHDNDLALYKQLDPTNETKIQAAKKAFKSTSGVVKQSAKDSMLTAAARKAKEEQAAVAANAVKEIQKIQMADAKKIIKLYEKDPEKFFNGETEVLNYFQYSDNKIDKLMKVAGLK